MNNEVLGIIGTLFILAGFVSDREVVIRVFDMIGSVLFVVYGAFIGSLSTVILNASLVLVHCYKFVSRAKNK